MQQRRFINAVKVWINFTKAWYVKEQKLRLLATTRMFNLVMNYFLINNLWRIFFFSFQQIQPEKLVYCGTRSHVSLFSSSHAR